MDYKKSYTLLWVGLIAGFVLMLIGVFLEIGWLLWPGAVVVMADVLQTLLFFRCVGSTFGKNPVILAKQGRSAFAERPCGCVEQAAP